jgi:hypothetical protein
MRHYATRRFYAGLIGLEGSYVVSIQRGEMNAETTSGGLEGSYVVSIQNIAETQQDGIRTV